MRVRAADRLLLAPDRPWDNRGTSRFRARRQRGETPSRRGGVRARFSRKKERSAPWRCRSRRLVCVALGVAVCGAATDVPARADAPDAALDAAARGGGGRRCPNPRRGLEPAASASSSPAAAAIFCRRALGQSRRRKRWTSSRATRSCSAWRATRRSWRPRARPTRGGATHITYAQRYKGLPVFGAADQGARRFRRRPHRGQRRRGAGHRPVRRASPFAEQAAPRGRSPRWRPSR